MADFQNRLISRILSVFSSVFLHRETLNRMDFDMFFWNFNFWPKVTILQRLLALQRVWMGLTDYRQNETKFRLPTEKKLTDYRLEPPLSLFVSRKKRSEEHFVFFFFSYEVTTLKVIIEFSVIFLLFGRKSARSFCRTISGTRAHDTSRCNISTTLFVHIRSSHKWNYKSDSEFLSKG